MIKISAEDKGETIAMSLEAHGDGDAIVEEAFAIVTELPKELKRMNPSLFQRLMAKISEALVNDEEVGNGLNH